MRGGRSRYPSPTAAGCNGKTMREKQIQMVDLQGQYCRLQTELEPAIREVLAGCAFINGPEVGNFCRHLAEYLQIPHVIPAGNGTDALQIALMALGLQPGDEVVVPAFTYVAAAEVVGLLGLTPVLADVDPDTFNLDPAKLEQAIGPRTKAVIAVHLFGQCCDMAPILHLAQRHGLYVVEDNAQSLGSWYRFPDGTRKPAGTMGHIGTTSFFPSKPLACYGDGGAMFTTSDTLARRLKMIANHGQVTKYHHQVIGCNSRLDTLQAAVLDVKLRHFDAFTTARVAAARRYDEGLAGLPGVRLPRQAAFTTHVYHQYTLQAEEGRREEIRRRLQAAGIPTMVYYPLPLQKQEAVRRIARIPEPPETAERLSRTVFSLPIHTELEAEEQAYIIGQVKEALGAGV